MKIPEEKQYEYLTHHLEYLNDKIIDSFELFIKLSTAIIGGVFFLYWKLKDSELSGACFVLISNILLCVVGIAMILLIINNLLAWRAYRKTLSEQYPDILPPHWIKWWLSEVIMILLILTTCILFSFNNPLGN